MSEADRWKRHSNCMRVPATACADAVDCLACAGVYGPVVGNIPATTLPTDAAARKAIPLASGCLDYFPDALIAIAELSRKGNDQHNPGQPLHWDRSKSGDEADADIRHFMERGKMDTDGVRHSTKHAWRALALLQKELEAAGAPMARGTK
jgi:hypothetical protein